MSEREGKWEGEHVKLGWRAILLGEEKMREQEGNKMGTRQNVTEAWVGHSILLRAKIGGNEKGTKREREWNTETTWKRTWVACNTCSLLAAFFFFSG
jgi:hypothetical protein